MISRLNTKCCNREVNMTIYHNLLSGIIIGIILSIGLKKLFIYLIVWPTTAVINYNIFYITWTSLYALLFSCKLTFYPHNIESVCEGRTGFMRTTATCSRFPLIGGRCSEPRPRGCQLWVNTGLGSNITEKRTLTVPVTILQWRHLRMSCHLWEHLRSSNQKASMSEEANFSWQRPFNMYDCNNNKYVYVAV